MRQGRTKGRVGCAHYRCQGPISSLIRVGACKVAVQVCRGDDLPIRETLDEDLHLGAVSGYVCQVSYRQYLWRAVLGACERVWGQMKASVRVRACVRACVCIMSAHDGGAPAVRTYVAGATVSRTAWARPQVMSLDANEKIRLHDCPAHVPCPARMGLDRSACSALQFE